MLGVLGSIWHNDLDPDSVASEMGVASFGLGHVHERTYNGTLVSGSAK